MDGVHRTQVMGIFTRWLRRFLCLVSTVGCDNNDTISQGVSEDELERFALNFNMPSDDYPTMNTTATMVLPNHFVRVVYTQSIILQAT